MSEEKKCNQFPGFMPLNNMMPPMPAFPAPPMSMPPMPSIPFGKEEKKANEVMDDFEADLMKFWKQVIDMQKSSIKSNRAQCVQFFDQFMGMQDTFTGSLPDVFPVLPGFPAFPVTPKYLVDELKKFQEMSKDHFMEQTDSYTDFFIKSQEQTRDVVGEIADNAADIRDGVEKEEKAEAKPAKKRAPKTAPKEEAPAKKKAPAKKRAPKTAEPKEEPAQDNLDSIL